MQPGDQRATVTKSGSREREEQIAGLTDYMTGELNGVWTRSPANPEREALPDRVPSATHRSGSPPGDSFPDRRRRFVRPPPQDRGGDLRHDLGQRQVKLGIEIAKVDGGKAVRVTPETVRSVWNDQPADTSS